jgi:hypothetical protein
VRTPRLPPPRPQVNVFLSMSAALRHMSAAMWPGLDSEGLTWFVDMTKPAVEWGTWATGYGVAGALLPLAVFGVYVRTLEYSAVGACPPAPRGGGEGRGPGPSRHAAPAQAPGGLAPSATAA